MVNSKPLTRDQALALLDALLAEYMKPAFQEKLQTVFRTDARNHVTRQSGEFERELREIRETVGAKFGYAASPEGVAQSLMDFTADLYRDPEIARKCRQMKILLSGTFRPVSKHRSETKGNQKQRSYSIQCCKTNTI